MRTTKLVTTACTAVVFVLGVFALASPAQAGKPWHSVIADTDFVGECATNVATVDVAAAPGGVSCYSNTFFVPGSANVLRVTVSTSGDTHNGARLRMGCIISSVNGGGVAAFCNAFGTGAAPGSYITKNKMPQPTGITNCDDGGGGSADCHDNSIEQTWCIPIVGDDVFTIDIRIGPGPERSGGLNIAFIEASTFMIDSTKMAGQCGAGNASG